MKNNLIVLIPFVKKHIIDLLFVFISIGYLYLLAVNFNFFSTMANSDIIQFLLDGRTYHTLRLPENIHASPLYPILITSVSYFFKDHFLFQEIAAARFINIISTIGSLTVLYLLASKLSNKVLAIGVVILAMLHPWTFMMAVGDYSETLFTFITLLSLYFYENKKKLSLAFLLSGVSFLVRNEGLLLFIAMFLVQIGNSSFNLNQISTKIYKIVRSPGFIIGFSIIVSWILVLVVNNLYSSKNVPQYSENLRYGYYFFYEIVERKNEIPELRFISNYTRFLFSFADYEATSFRDPYLWLGILFVAVLFKLFIVSKSSFIRISSVYILFYLGIHALFPAFTHRYFYPVLFLGYLLFLPLLHSIFSFNFKKRFQKYVTLLFFLIVYILIIVYTILNFSDTVEYPKNYYDTYRKVSQLINTLVSSSTSNTVNIYMDNPFEKYYFTGIERNLGYRSGWIEGYYQDHFGKYHATYSNDSTLVRFINVDHIKSMNCLNIECIQMYYPIEKSESHFIYTRTDQEVIASFYEKYFEEVWPHPVSDQINTDDPSKIELRLYSPVFVNASD